MNYFIENIKLLKKKLIFFQSLDCNNNFVLINIYKLSDGAKLSYMYLISEILFCFSQMEHSSIRLDNYRQMSIVT